MCFRPPSVGKSVKCPKCGTFNPAAVKKCIKCKEELPAANNTAVKAKKE